MTLSEFLVSLTNTDALVTVLDADNTELVKLYAPGYAQLIATLLAREVSKVTVVNPKAITVVLVGEGSF